MSIRHVARAASTVLVAIVVALTVPISQLRAVSVVTTCCCPDPSRCHCPDHKPDHSRHSTLRACHRSTQVAEAPQLPPCAAPVVALAAPAAPVTLAPHPPLASPHAPPSPARPDAPS